MSIKVFESQTKDKAIQLRVTEAQHKMIKTMAIKKGYGTITKYILSLLEKDLQESIKK